VRLALLLVLVALGACGPVPTDETPEPEAASAKIPASFKRTESGGVRDTGNFVVKYEKTENADYQELEAIFKETRLLEDTVQELNNVFSLPSQVPVVFKECGDVNAFYDPEAQEISLCWELVEYYAGMFLSEEQTEEEAQEGGEAVAGATLFTFFHELGHALIDLYDLPVTGREEDAVDQLATMILLEGGEEGEMAALNGAWSFLTEEEEDVEGQEEYSTEEQVEEEEELAFWDEHSLDEQRFYNIVCWSYGKNPENLQYLVDDETLPEGRAERCPAEYDRMSRSWDALLNPYVKE
jgi:Putative metallopeptidase